MIGEWIAVFDEGPLWAIAVLLFLLMMLAGTQYDLTYHTVRIYNWDGKRYRFLGRVRLRKKNDIHVVNLRERMGEASFTTGYLLLPSRKFVKRYRYGSLLFRAGKAERWLPVEERMRADVLYVYP